MPTTSTTQEEKDEEGGGGERLICKSHFPPINSLCLEACGVVVAVSSSGDFVKYFFFAAKLERERGGVERDREGMEGMRDGGESVGILLIILLLQEAQVHCF